MPVQLFTEAERVRRNRFPDVIASEDLVTFFTLSERDRRSIPRSQLRADTLAAVRHHLKRWFMRLTLAT